MTYFALLLFSPLLLDLLQFGHESCLVEVIIVILVGILILILLLPNIG